MYAFSGAAKIGLRTVDHNRITIEPGKRGPANPVSGSAHHSGMCRLACGRQERGTDHQRLDLHQFLPARRR
jgi:hypothetical protein